VLVNALKAELGSRVNEAVSFDEDRLKPGYSLNNSLSQYLYQSACMVVFFTPHYFNLEKLYCAREFFAMLDLERQRLGLLPAANRNHGLIIPVAYRGFDQMLKQVPEAEKAWRRSAKTSPRLGQNFQSFQGWLSKNDKARVAAIATEVEARCDLFRNLFGQKGKDPFRNFTSFRLPNEAKAKAVLLKTLKYKALLPTKEAA